MTENNHYYTITTFAKFKNMLLSTKIVCIYWEYMIETIY